MSSDTYREKLRDPRWQKRRLEMMTLADWQCQQCANPHDELHVHHIRYFKGREPWEYDDQWLKVLCSACHSKEHQDKPQKSDHPRGVVFRRSAKVHYITLHEDLYEVCSKNACAAMILDYLMREHCRLVKLRQIARGHSEWTLVQKVSVSFLGDVLVWSYSKTSISNSIKALAGLGLIQIHKRRPKGAAYDRRHYLEVNVPKIQAALDSIGGVE